MKTITDFLSRKSTIMAGILILAIVLRLYHYTANPMWIDECWTLYVSQHSWIEIPFLDVHPPVNYWLVKVVTLAFGASEAVIRMPSLVFGIIAVALIYFFAREFTGNEWAGIIAAGLLAVSRDAVFHAQDARSYTLWLCVFMVFGIVYLKACKHPERRTMWILAGLLAGACMWVHYWSIFPLVFLGLYALWRCRKQIKQMIYGFVAFTGLFIPLIPIFLQGISIKSSEGWTIFHPWNVILQNTWMEFSSYEPILAIMFGVLTIIGLYILVSNRSRIHEFEIAMLLFAGTALVFLTTSPWFMTIPKYAMYLVPFVYSLVGLGWCSALTPYVKDRKWVAFVGVWLLIVMAATPLMGYYEQTNRDGWYDNDAQLSLITNGSPVAIIANPGLAMQWDYYYSGVSEPFRSMDGLEKILAKNNGTYVFVPANEIPPDLPEAQQINTFLHENGVLVGTHRGFEGWYVG
jgi:4-amino-4-deoxy-L-arabinose transferase-like glycosyltransferase